MNDYKKKYQTVKDERDILQRQYDLFFKEVKVLNENASRLEAKTKEQKLTIEMLDRREKLHLE